MTLLETLKTLLSVPERDRAWWSTVVWWEKRRLIFNVIVGTIGLLNLLAFGYINDVLLAPYLPFRDRDWEPLSALLAPVVLNVAYTSGWITELLLRRVLRRDLPRFGPIMFRAGLGLSLLLSFVPPVTDGLKWAFLAARANHVQ